MRLLLVVVWSSLDSINYMTLCLPWSNYACPWRHLTNWWRSQDYQGLSLGTLLINFIVGQEKLVKYKVSWLSKMA